MPAAVMLRAVLRCSLVGGAMGTAELNLQSIDAAKVFNNLGKGLLQCLVLGDIGSMRVSCELANIVSGNDGYHTCRA